VSASVAVSRAKNCSNSYGDSHVSPFSQGLRHASLAGLAILRRRWMVEQTRRRQAVDLAIQHAAVRADCRDKCPMIVPVFPHRQQSSHSPRFQFKENHRRRVHVVNTRKDSDCSRSKDAISHLIRTTACEVTLKLRPNVASKEFRGVHELIQAIRCCISMIASPVSYSSMTTRYVYRNSPCRGMPENGWRVRWRVCRGQGGRSSDRKRRIGPTLVVPRPASV